MTNDTTTLNGALRELGETMAANLTTQGVPSTYDEGLTTLAGKILDIHGGGSSVASVSLTGSSAILSYADSDTLTLTATALDSSSVGVSGQTVTFYKGSTSLGTATTDSNGQATMSYASTGAGDVSFTAECSSISSVTYVVEDCLMYDATEYSRTGTGSATCVATNSKTWDNTIDWEFTAEIKVTGKSCRIDLTPPSQSLNYHLGLGKNASNYLASYVGKNGGGEYSQLHSSYSINNGTYYTMKITRESGTVKWYFEGNLLKTDTTYATTWLDNYSTESAKFTTWSTSTIYIKEMKVKAL